MVGQTYPEILAEGEAAARLAARDRLAVPDVRPRGTPGNPGREARLQDSPEREDRRDQSEHHRARRKDPHGQGLPAARAFRRCHGDRSGVLQASRRRVPGQRHPIAQRREAPQSRFEHDQVRPWFGADDRPDEPLQHDVRSVFHGREPGRLRARVVVGGHQDAARQRDLDQAEASDVGAVLGRRAHDVAVFPGCGAVLEEGRVQQRAGGDQRHRVRQESGVRPCGV